jgi:WD40 repeat protein
MAHIGDAIVSGGYDGRLIWWNVAEHKQVRDVAAHARWIRRVIGTPDATRVVSVADDMQIKVWDAASGELVTAFTDHSAMTPHNYPSMLYAVAASPDGKWLASADKVGHVVVWDLATYEKAAQLETPVMYTWDAVQRRHSIGGARSVSFSPDGTKLAVGGIGKIGNIDHLDGKARVEVFDWQAGTRLFELEDEQQKGLVEQIAWGPDAGWILTAGGHDKGFLTFYDMNSGEMLHQQGNEGHIHGFVVDEAWENVYAACHHRLEKWTLAGG